MAAILKSLINTGWINEIASRSVSSLQPDQRPWGHGGWGVGVIQHAVLLWAQTTWFHIVICNMCSSAVAPRNGPDVVHEPYIWDIIQHKLAQTSLLQHTHAHKPLQVSRVLVVLDAPGVADSAQASSPPLPMGVEASHRPAPSSAPGTFYFN